MRYLCGLVFIILLSSAVSAIELASKARPAISTSEVKEYKEIPPNAEEIGTVSASVFSYFGGAEAKRDIRKQAAAAGANGFTIIEKNVSGGGIGPLGKPSAKSYDVTAVIFYVDSYTTSTEESTSIGSKIGVIPFSPQGIEEEEAEIVAKMITKKISIDAEVVDHDDMMEALDDVDCDDEDDWNERECIQDVGKELDIDYILAGSIRKTEEVVITEISLYDINEETAVWSHQYRYEGSIENFGLTYPQKIADEVTNVLYKSMREKKTQASEESQENDRKSITSSDIGIVRGATIGLKSLFTLGKVTGTQSPAGFSVMFLFPTSDKSHARVRAGIPSWHHERNTNASGKEYPDPYLLLEHAWGWKSFGVSAGLAYMYMQRYTGRTLVQYDASYTFKYDPFNAFNLVVSIRGGRSKAGFHGMVSFPLAFTIDRDNMNFLIEYCAGGVFGVKKTKFGIGSSGMFKRRYADKVTIDDGDTVYTENVDNDIWGDDYNRSDHLAREFFCLLPHIKFAQLFGDYFVASLTLDLGGIIIPRPQSKESWKPSIGCDFIFSFGKLDGPNLYDGTF